MSKDLTMRKTSGGTVPRPRRKGAASRIAKKKRELFLNVLADTGMVENAARAVGYASSVTLNVHRKNDPEFAEAWDQAEQAACDKFEAELIRRAVEGIPKPQYFRGEKIDTLVEYSDGLLQFLLKAKRPEIYGERKKVDVNVGGEVGVAVLPMAGNDSERWERESRAINEQTRAALEKEKEEENVLIEDAEFEDITLTPIKR